MCEYVRKYVRKYVRVCVCEVKHSAAALTNKQAQTRRQTHKRLFALHLLCFKLGPKIAAKERSDDETRAAGAVEPAKIGGSLVLLQGRG